MSHSIRLSLKYLSFLTVRDIYSGICVTFAWLVIAGIPTAIFVTVIDWLFPFDPEKFLGIWPMPAWTVGILVWFIMYVPVLGSHLISEGKDNFEKMNSEKNQIQA